jgi:hypothetical protein
MGLHVLDHSAQFLALDVLLGSAYLLAENSLNAPTITLGKGGKFIYLTLIVLNVGTHSGKDADSIHI